LTSQQIFPQFKRVLGDLVDLGGSVGLKVQLGLQVRKERGAHRACKGNEDHKVNVGLKDHLVLTLVTFYRSVRKERACQKMLMPSMGVTSTSRKFRRRRRKK